MLTVREENHSGRAPATRAVRQQRVPETLCAEQPNLRSVCIAHHPSEQTNRIGVPCTACASVPKRAHPKRENRDLGTKIGPSLLNIPVKPIVSTH